MNKSSAYTTKETILLAQLVRKHEVVENKKIDATTLEQKNKAWELITKAFNAQPEVTVPRSSSQLRKLWSNLKQRKRKQNTEETEGGLPKRCMPDPVMNFVKDAVPNMDVTVSCPWDSTCTASLEEGTEVKLEEDPLAQAESTERDVRIRKIEEAIEQQREVHSIRLKILQEERELNKQKGDLEMKKLELEIRKAEDEAELASLKLAEHMCKMANGMGTRRI